ncbi:glycosyltransferase family 9 protein [bacterium]|nr:glycosyltransferase family 9 protein [bacterium]
MNNTFLLCHRGALGDFILTWAAISALRKTFHDEHFKGLGRPEYTRLAKRLGLLDSFHDAESSAMLGFFSGQNIPPELELGSLKGAVLWINQGEHIAGLLKPASTLPIALIPPLPSLKVHASLYHYLSMKRYFPISAPYSLPDFHLRRETKEYILIHPGSGSPTKNYTPLFYKSLANGLFRSGYADVRFLIGPAELKCIDSYLDGDILIEQPQDIDALLELLVNARLYIGNDSGVSHLAGIIGTPAIAFYKSTDPMIWGVTGRDVKHILAKDEDEALQKTKEHFPAIIEN